MYTRAKKILASELMYALEKDEERGRGHLDDILHARRHAGRRGDPSRPRRRWRSRSSWPPAAANALVPTGPRRSSCWRAGRCSSGARRRSRRGRRARRRGAARRARTRRRAATGVRGRRDPLGVGAQRRWPPRPPRRRRASSTTPRARWSPPSSFARCARGARRDARRAIAAAPVTDTVKEAGGRRRRRAHARPLAAVGDPDAAGLPPRALERALDVPDEVLAAATDDAWLVERAGGTVRGREPRPRTSRSPPRTTCASPSCCCATRC